MTNPSSDGQGEARSHGDMSRCSVSKVSSQFLSDIFVTRSLRRSRMPGDALRASKWREIPHCGRACQLAGAHLAIEQKL
jgi:hypothetical protein